jgi:hypothetical protein
MKKSICLSMAAVMLLPALLYAQPEKKEKKEKDNTFSTSIQIRSRGEYRNGVLMPRLEGSSPAGFINSRARLSLDYKRSDMLQVHLSAQHVGVWGQDPQIDKSGRLVLNEAWGQFAFGHGFFVRLGRQQLVYDDERILGALDWNVAGRSHDALKLGFENAHNKLHLIFSFNQNDEKTIGGSYYAPGAQPYKTMQTAWYHYDAPAKWFHLSLLFMNLGWETGDAATQTAKTRYMQTMGTYFQFTPNNWTVNGTFYYQSGKNKTANSVSAYMAALSASYKIDKQWSIKGNVDYLSGDKDNGGKYNAFDPLYGTHHKFYGAMDYFYASSFINGLAPGLWDGSIGGSFKPSTKVNLSLNYHCFATGVKVADAKKYLGSEVDAQVDWNIMKNVSLSAGYSLMRGSSSMDLVKGGSHKSWQDWGWLSININPEVFHIKW